MKYIEALGYRLSRLTLGTVQLGMKYGIANRAGQPAKEEAVSILHTAFDKGVTVLDTAHNYGTSESIIGETLEEHPARDKIIVVTKLDPFKLDAGEGSDIAQQKIEQSLKASLKNLRRESIDLYMMHDPDHLKDPEIRKQLLAFQESGIVKNIGVSVYSPDEADLALSTEGISAVQVPFNVFDQRLIKSGFLKKAGEKGLLVFARSIFLQGLVLMDESSVPGHLKDILQLNKQLRTICEEAGRPLKEVAIKFALAQEGISSLVVGVETVAQLEETISCFDSSPLEESVVRRIQDVFSDLPEYLVNPSLWSRK